jgi:hypothetical protein
VLTYGYSRYVRDALKCVAMPLLEPEDKIFVARADLDDDDRWYRAGTTAELGKGNADLLLSLVENDPELGVLILLGAESFDRCGRFVQMATSLLRSTSFSRNSTASERPSATGLSVWW